VGGSLAGAWVVQSYREAGGGGSVSLLPREPQSFSAYLVELYRDHGIEMVLDDGVALGHESLS
jgi:hypothetical protein